MLANRRIQMDEWEEDKKINLATYAKDNKKLMIVEVDLEYPISLHKLHNDYPLAAEKMRVNKDMLSPHCEMIRDKYGISIGQVSKLIPTLSNKEKYVLHYRNMQLYLDRGLKLKKVHCVLEFDQTPWLKQYIDFNSTQKRMNAKNSFQKDFFKLMNNSVFGKTMENLRKRVDVRLVTDQKKLSKLPSKPAYVNSKIFKEDLVAVHKMKETLTLDRLAYVGMCILDLSKTQRMTFNIIILTRNIKAKPNYYSPIRIHLLEIRQKMSIKIFGLTKKSLIIAIFNRKITNTLIQPTRKSLASLRMKLLVYQSDNLLG